MSAVAARLDVAGRVLVAALFWWSAVFGVALDWQGTVGFVMSKGLPLPELVAAGTGAFEILAPLALFHRRLAGWAALALAAFCLATAGIFHDWWAHAGGARANQMAHFMKNTALAGALLALAAGPLRNGAVRD